MELLRRELQLILYIKDIILFFETSKTFYLSCNPDLCKV